MIENNIFMDIAIIIVTATCLGFLARSLKQPIIPAFLLTGILLGPFGLKLVTNMETVRTLSEIGIALLLFVVGIELNFKKLGDIHLIASVGALLRSLTIATIGFIVIILLGMRSLEAAYLAAVIAFSSTSVVIKILSDKRELDTLHGRIMIGILLVEDIIAIVVLSVFSTLHHPNGFAVAVALGSVIALVMVAWLFSKLLVPWLFNIAAKSQELLFLSAMAVLFFFSLASYLLNISIAIGAFIAGVTLANLPYQFEIAGRVKPLRDFFATIFFVALGLELGLSNIGEFMVPIVILIVLVLIMKPLITMFICSYFEYSKKTSFLTSLSLAQVSEFGLVIGAQGLLLGHISHAVFDMMLVIAMVTIGLTPYFMKYDKNIYLALEKFLSIFTVFGKALKEKAYQPKKFDYEVIIVGYDRIGFSVLKTLRSMKKKVVVIDFNPEVIRKAMHKKIPCMYGDIGDPEIMESLDFKKTTMIISTIPSLEENMFLISSAKSKNKEITTFVTANDIDDALALYDHGADYVILPHFLGGDRVSLLLTDLSSDMNRFLKTKRRHIRELRKRKIIGQKHPIKMSEHERL